MENNDWFLFFAGIAAIVSVAMWVDYFRCIDVFAREHVPPLLFALFVGGCTTEVCLAVYDWIENAGYHETGEFWPDLAYAILAIGLNEEVCKLIGVFVVFVTLQRIINEPIDYFIYAGVTALGFSLVENFAYFNNHGIRIITSRAFYSALEHIINTSIIVYGFYRLKLFGKGSLALNSVTGFVIAVCSHGLFDFFLTESFTGYLTAIFSLIIYLIGINFWIQMLNNANNYSDFFDYDKIHFSAKLVRRLLMWFLLTLLIAFLSNAVIAGVRFAVVTLIFGLLSDGLLFLIVILRVSRFKILKRAYLRVEIAFPFYITKNNDEDFRIPFLNWPIKVRGENSREHMLTRFIGRGVIIQPLDPNDSGIGIPLNVTISEKFLLFDDVVVYKVKLPETFFKAGRIYVLKPRMSSSDSAHDKYPVHGLFYADLPENAQLSQTHYRDLIFFEWVSIKPLD